MKLSKVKQKLRFGHRERFLKMLLKTDIFENVGSCGRSKKEVFEYDTVVSFIYIVVRIRVETDEND